MEIYTEGDLFRAWTEGWHAGFKDYRATADDLTPNPYAQKSGLEAPAKKSLQTAETEPLAEETIMSETTELSTPTHYATFWDASHREVSIAAYETGREGVRLRVADIPWMILELKDLYDTARDPA